MASTNKTTNYELSQYVGSDKPSYLNDYNQDMSKIDLGIHAAKSEADNNATAIGDLTTLTTTAKTDLVSALNEVDSTASTANATAVQANGKADDNTTDIGTLANLTTTAKTNLVAATNEVNGKVGSLTDLETTSKTNVVSAINEVGSTLNFVNFKDYEQYPAHVTTSHFTVTSNRISIATNADGSVFKIYGDMRGTTSSGAVSITFTNTGISPASAFDIRSAGFQYQNNSDMYAVSLSIAANGDVTITLGTKDGNYSERVFLFPCIYIAKDFGDTPEI